MQLISDKPLRVATTRGHIVVFEPGVPQEVVEEASNAAMALGARPYTEKTRAAKKEPIDLDKAMAEIAKAEAAAEPEPVTEDIAPVESTGRHDEIVATIRELVLAGDPEDFKSDGIPKAAAICRKLGYSPSTEERDAAWATYIEG